jgi:2-oxoglutarate ferredoxin oxidoreductase subunit gamma
MAHTQSDYEQTTQTHSEYELLIVGIGGQGIQLIGKTLALAATVAGRHAMLAAEYGGEMRGGPSQSTVVVGDQPLRSLPILPSAGAAIVMHDKFSGPVPERLRAGGLLVVNSSIVDPGSAAANYEIRALPATTMARELGAPQTAGFILLGAFNAVAQIVEPEQLTDAMRSLLPPYRREHADTNAAAISLGADAAKDLDPVAGAPA